MADSSSTSSFELNPLERVNRRRFPAALVTFLIAVAAIEVTVSRHREWFADLAAWQWETKRTLLAAGDLTGDIAIYGTSVLFHGIDPVVANQGLPQGHRVVNLALNGMLLQHQTQLLREQMTAPDRPSLVVLELRHATIARSSWTTGPYFRFWASAPEFFESRFYYWEPPLALTFAGHRVLPSYRYRDALNNWLSESLVALKPTEHTRIRNEAVVAEMRQHEGFVRADFETRSLEGYTGPRKPREWLVDSAGWSWLREFLTTAAGNNVEVVLLLPPAPPYLYEEPGPNGFRARYNRDIAKLRAEFPSLALPVFEPRGYALGDFADVLHLNARGREKLSREFADWLVDYQNAHGGNRKTRLPDAVKTSAR
jgi:hypothetical protein